MIDGGAKKLPSPWRRTQASTRKLLSADSFISVDIYQVNYPCSFRMFTTTCSARLLTYTSTSVHAQECVWGCICLQSEESSRGCGSSAVSFGDTSKKYTRLNWFSKRLISGFYSPPLHRGQDHWCCTL